MVEKTHSDYANTTMKESSHNVILIEAKNLGISFSKARAITSGTVDDRKK